MSSSSFSSTTSSKILSFVLAHDFGEEDESFAGSSDNIREEVSQETNPLKSKSIDFSRLNLKKERRDPNLPQRTEQNALFNEQHPTEIDDKLPLLQHNNKHTINGSNETKIRSSSSDGRKPIRRCLSAIQRWMEHMHGTIKANKLILLWCSGAIASNVMMAVFIKHSANRMPSFPYFLFWFTGLVFLAVFWAYYMILRRFQPTIAAESRDLPHKKFMIVGLLTALNGIFILFPNPYVPGITQVLLGPAVFSIPIVMLFSMLILRRRYSFTQIGAVSVILIGEFFAIYPSIMEINASSHGHLSWNVLYLMASFPISLAAVYEEKVFTEKTIHLSHLLAWVTLYQMITIVIAAPVDLIPNFGNSASVKDLFTNQIEALKCLGRKEVSVQVCPGCDCEWAFVPIILYIIGYLSSSFFILGVIKHGNATFSFLVAAISLPVTEVIFILRPVMGHYAERLTPFNYISLAIILLGTVLYRIFDSQQEERAKLRQSKLFRRPSVFNVQYAAPLPGYQNFQPHMFKGDEDGDPDETEPYHWTFP